MVNGEMYRIGDGWWPPQNWGCWLKGDRAEIAFSLPSADVCAYILHLGLRGTPGSSADFAVWLIDSRPAVSDTLGPGQDRWVTVEIDAGAVRERVVHLRLTTTGRHDLGSEGDGTDRRTVTLGVLGFKLDRTPGMYGEAAIAAPTSGDEEIGGD